MPVIDAHQTSRTTRRRRDGARGAAAAPPDLKIRAAHADDLAQVIALDARVTGIEKPDFFFELFHRYGTRGLQQRFFLVAESAGAIRGFILGDVRDWEFGSPPCGWVFGINVQPDARLGGIGTMLLHAICDNFRRARVTKVRTLLARDNSLVLSFFRSQGMMAAPVIPLEMDL